MSTAAFIAGDWGTSNLRLRLYSDDGAVLDGGAFGAARGA